MNEQQQKLYDKLLKKVNEYCLGAAAEDVIAAIDALVDDYEIAVDEADDYATLYSEVATIMNTILHYSYNNRFIVKQAFDEGWISEAQYQLMIDTFGYYNCTGREEPDESTN